MNIFTFLYDLPATIRQLQQQQLATNKAMSKATEDLAAIQEDLDATKLVLDSVLEKAVALKAALTSVSAQLAEIIAQQPPAGFANLVNAAQANLDEANAILATFADPVPPPPVESAPPVETAP